MGEFSKHGNDPIAFTELDFHYVLQSSRAQSARIEIEAMMITTVIIGASRMIRMSFFMSLMIAPTSRKVKRLLTKIRCVSIMKSCLNTLNSMGLSHPPSAEGVGPMLGIGLHIVSSAGRECHQ